MSWQATQDFAERLRALKSSHGWTIEEMAAMCDVPKRTLEGHLAWRNTTEPSLGTLAKLATGLDVSLNWLALGKGPIPLPEKRS